MNGWINGWMGILMNGLVYECVDICMHVFVVDVLRMYVCMGK